MKILLRVQSALNALSAHPITFAAAALFLGIWIGTFVASKGRFDPGLGIGNLIINGIGLLLMFSACALAQHAAQSSDDRTDSHSELHAKIDALSEHVGVPEFKPFKIK